MKKSLSAIVLLGLALQFLPRVSAQQQTESKSREYTGLPWAYGFSAPATPAEIAAALVPRGGGRGGAGAPPAGGRGGGGRGGAAAVPAPAEPAEDMEAIRHVPGSTQAFNLKQVGSNSAPADWFPEDHPAMPETVAHGKRTPQVNACAFCHYPNGKGRPNNAGPAGLPANYILQQLEDFASGARNSWDKRKRNTTQMIDYAKGLTPEEAKAAAEYFAAIKWTPWFKVVETEMIPKMTFVGGGGGLILPLEGPEAGMEPLGIRIIETPLNAEQTEPLRNPRSGFIAYVPKGSLKKGEALVLGGGGGKTVACASCHGEGLKGTDKFPSLAGRSPSYLARQLYDFQHFTRVGPGSTLMQPVVKNLGEEDILNITAYLASLQP